uniref:Uncharacterized protein n=1 Tax=Sphaerodactylus townsendi TaxID=933632 RepID=A0ACB8ETL7_9SAUR
MFLGWVGNWVGRMAKMGLRRVGFYHNQEFNDNHDDSSEEHSVEIGVPMDVLPPPPRECWGPKENTSRLEARLELWEASCRKQARGPPRQQKEQKRRGHGNGTDCYGAVDRSQDEGEGRSQRDHNCRDMDYQSYLQDFDNQEFNDNHDDSSEEHSVEDSPNDPLGFQGDWTYRTEEEQRANSIQRLRMLLQSAIENDVRGLDSRALLLGTCHGSSSPPFLCPPLLPLAYPQG